MPIRLKRLLSVFLWAFVLNLIWENLHVFLYAHYLGQKITEGILLRATFTDALIIFIILMPFIYISSLKKRSWLIIPVGIALALVVELFALKTGRWAYNDFMPLIPLLSVGITPAIQLGLLGYTTFKLQEYFLR